ncbi:hypothetical protein KC318_g7605 [Hortaea werneckii]|nr:hypothetical protein KC334_g8201 [Hortaea werneckii]KAI6947484.1 hypothetical protein KC355_g14841 [Hortaea werneckii]KAI7145650.1 hypothetical protein KC324_g15867 [Hortaea werneckii]KAI7537785.1 hypothetical protein KC316_g15874 [Hortaea werneckii]KAI7664651.1 hypothetical protein KC318_g7605 [Hortaea werneckii]
MQSPDNWRLKDFERLNQVLLEYWNRLRGQQMVMAPYLGGGGGVGRPGSLMPSWMMGSPGMNFGDVMGVNCGMGVNPLRRGGRFGGSDYGSWEDEMMQRMKRMEEIAKDYEDRVRGISDHLYGSSAERQEEMYRKRQQQMWQDFMQGQQTQNAMGMNGLGGMGGGMGSGMNGLAQMMPMQALAGGMNPMMAGMGGLGGLMNPLQMGALGSMGANPLMGGAGLGAGNGAEDDRFSRRRRLGSRRRNSMFQDDDDDDDDDILPRRRFGRRRRGGFGDDDDDLFPGRFGEGEIPEDIYPEPTFQAADKAAAAALGGNLARNPGTPMMPVPEEPGPIPTVGQAGRGLAADEALPPPPPPPLPRPNNPRRSSLKKTVSFQGETSHLTRPRREEDDRGEAEAGAEPGPRDL